MTRRPLFTVDAFADRPFAGNPAAVMVVDEFPPDDLMQALAAEMNLSETAFCRPDGGGFDLRWMTPVREVPFCGHATLATAHVLATEYGVAGPMVFSARVGRLVVTVEGDRYRLDVPALPPEPADAERAAAEAALGIPVRTLVRNFENLFAEVADAAAVRSATPDLARVAALSTGALCVTAADGDGFVSRYFAPAGGIPEDPVTGSTHATLVPFWAARLGRTEFVARQLSARGGTLACRLAGDRVEIAGAAVTVLRATVDQAV